MPLIVAVLLPALMLCISLCTDVFSGRRGSACWRQSDGDHLTIPHYFGLVSDCESEEPRCVTEEPGCESEEPGCVKLRAATAEETSSSTVPCIAASLSCNVPLQPHHRLFLPTHLCACSRCRRCAEAVLQAAAAFPRCHTVDPAAADAHSHSAQAGVCDLVQLARHTHPRLPPADLGAAHWADAGAIPAGYGQQRCVPYNCIPYCPADSEPPADWSSNRLMSHVR